MDSFVQQPDDTTLSAWLDGELDDETRATVEAWLREHPDDAARVRLWAADREALRARFDPVLAEPVPEALQRTVREGGRSGGQGPGAWRGWRLAAAAAGLMVGGGLLGGALVWQLQPARELAAARSSWTQRAAVAHAVYAPELRHPVEVNVAEGQPAEQHAQEEHLARWLTKRLDMPVRLFDLRAQGFTLVGGRLLPDAQGPSAQLMYQNAGGQRVTVYLRRPEPGTNTSFRYQREGELGMFYWAEEGYGCALVGKLPRERLLALAEAAYQQVEQDLPGLKPRPSS
ncbi:anti-sigma factor family protein [Aquabacterium sp.]|uniref:anti-sigma factor family protein n=1 Tax=Aquabacterium sp. TaxID=1872578 RepID=UPI003783D5CB